LKRVVRLRRRAPLYVSIVTALIVAVGILGILKARKVQSYGQLNSVQLSGVHRGQ